MANDTHDHKGQFSNNEKVIHGRTVPMNDPFDRPVIGGGNSGMGSATMFGGSFMSSVPANESSSKNQKD